MAQLENLEVLVVEANQGMRAQLRTMLDGFNITGVQFAASAGAAIRKLREGRYDLILCEYDLGEGQDGQHLLEDLRTQKIISLDTLFIIISSERSYERVVGAAELTPDDYILKPLTPGTLLMRLQRALTRRDAFLPAYRMIEAGESQAAIDYCFNSETDHPPGYRVDFMRMRAELLDGQGQSQQAEAVYRTIIDVKPAPWARLGLAKMLFASKRYDEAATLLEALVNESAYYLDAYDWLARTRAALDEPVQALDVLANAVQLSPHRMSRLRQFGDVALKAGDYERAERALSEVVRKGKYSEFRDPEDHVQLLKAQLIQQKFSEAANTIGDLEKSMSGQPSAGACSSLSKALLHQCTGNQDGAREALRDAVRAARETDLPTSLKHELIKACLDNQLESEGSELVISILRNAADEQTVEQTRTLLRQRGREDLSERIEENLHTEVKSYIAAGASKAQTGDYDGAVSEMMNAVRKMPGNPHVSFNAALALLRHIENNGWNERFAAQARALILRTRKLDPKNPRIEAISQFMQGLVKKFGIRTGAMPVGGSPEQTVLPGRANRR